MTNNDERGACRIIDVPNRAAVDRRLSDAEAATLLYLLCRVGDGWLPLEELARDRRTTTETIVRHAEHLEALEYLRVELRADVARFERGRLSEVAR